MNIFRLRRKSKKINFRRYLLLLFSLVMTTFAWFAYSKVLDTDLNLNMISWDIEFWQGTNELANPINIAIQDLYPGMDDRVIEVAVKNNGQATATIYHTIEKIEILGQEYTMTSDENATLDTDQLYVPEPTVDSGVSVRNVINDSTRFPFFLTIESSEDIGPESEGYLKIKISWPGTDNVLDTKWGYDITKYYNSPSAGQALKLSLKVDAIQKDI